MPILFTWIELLKEEAMQIVLSQNSIDLNKIVLEDNEVEAVSFLSRMSFIIIIFCKLCTGQVLFPDEKRTS